MPPENESTRPPAQLLAAQDRFIATWGQMGSAWGISRTIAEIHALLYITGKPLCTDDIMERLQISRGNASMSLRALLDWGIVHKTSRRGDRKEYYGAEQDVMVMFQTIARERKKRELDPVIASLYEVRDMTHPSRVEGKATRPVREHNKRLDDMLGFISGLERIADEILKPEGAGLAGAIEVLSAPPES